MLLRDKTTNNVAKLNPANVAAVAKPASDAAVADIAGVAVKVADDEEGEGEGEDNEADLRAELERLRSENGALKAAAAKPIGKLTPKVSQKGAISIYGFGPRPITAYAEQWEKILAMDLGAFIADAKAKKLVRPKDETVEAYCKRLNKPLPKE